MICGRPAAMPEDEFVPGQLRLSNQFNLQPCLMNQLVLCLIFSTIALVHPVGVAAPPSGNAERVRSVTDLQRACGELDVAFVIGAPINVMLASATSVELGRDELTIANTLAPVKTVTLGNGVSVTADAEIAVEATRCTMRVRLSTSQKHTT